MFFLFFSLLTFFNKLTAGNCESWTTLYVNDNSNCGVNPCDGSSIRPFSTIQEALDMVTNDYFSIVLNYGVYSGTGNVNLQIHGFRVAIRALHGASAVDNTIIDCKGENPFIEVIRGHIDLYSLTIQNCVAATHDVESYNILDENGDVIIGSNQNQRIGGGLFIEHSYAWINNCIFKSNSAYIGGAIYTYSSDIELISTKIIDNTATQGGGIYISNAAMFCNDLAIISNNTAISHGGGILIEDGFLVINTSSIISDNKATAGGGIYFKSSTIEFDKESIIYNNIANWNGYGDDVFCYKGYAGWYNNANLGGLTLNDFNRNNIRCYPNCELEKIKNGEIIVDYCEYEGDDNDNDDSYDSSEENDSNESNESNEESNTASGSNDSNDSNFDSESVDPSTSGSHVLVKNKYFCTTVVTFVVISMVLLFA